MFSSVYVHTAILSRKIWYDAALQLSDGEEPTLSHVAIDDVSREAVSVRLRA